MLRRLEGQEVPPRHAEHEPVDVGVGLVGEQVADPLDPVGEPRGELLPHVAPLEHPRDPGDQLVQQGPPPRGPRRRPGRERVRLGQEDEGAETFGRSHRGRDVEDQVLLGEVAAGRGVREEEVVRDHERRELAVVVVDAHRGELLGCDRRAERHVVALADLADVVQQRAQQQGVGPLLAAEQRPHVRGGARQMRVDREPVVRVALGPAPDVGPARQEPLQQIGAVEHVEHRDPVGAATEQREERLADRRGPGHRVGTRRRRSRPGSRRGSHRRHRRPPRGRAGRRRARPRIAAGSTGWLQHASSGDGERRFHVARVLEQRPHQRIGRHEPRPVGEPEPCRERRLQLDDQPVGAAVGGEVDRRCGRAPGTPRRRRPPRLRARSRSGASTADPAATREPAGSRRRRAARRRPP